MSIVFRADDAPASSRTDYWHEVIADTIGPIEVWTPERLDSRDRLRVGEAGPVRVAELSIGAWGGAERTGRHIRRADPDVYKIDVLVRGSGVIAQDGREARQRPGDLTFVDLSRPCRWRNSPSQMLALVFPRALLPLRRDDLARLTGVGVAGDRGLGALVSSLARRLPGHLDDCGPAERTRLGTAVLDLIAAALAARLDRARDVPPESRQRALVLRIHAFIEEHLGDPRLSPRTVAAAHHISVRYLHRLFQAEQTTVAGWIRRRRLERCRHDLLDPELATLPVSAIAARRGLTSAAHFSRAFRAAYGVPPTEHRALGRTPVSA